MRSVQFMPQAFDEASEWLFEDKKTLQRIMRIIKECQRTPFEGIGKPEPLKGDLAGMWSRRVTDEHRLVYQVEFEKIIIISLKGHYL